MRMKAYISLLLCVFCLLSSCQQDFQEEVMADNIKSRSTAKPTFFTDIKNMKILMVMRLLKERFFVLKIRNIQLHLLSRGLPVFHTTPDSGI